MTCRRLSRTRPTASAQRHDDERRAHDRVARAARRARRDPRHVRRVIRRHRARGRRAGRRRLRGGRDRGPLQGIPLGVKDIIAGEGRRRLRAARCSIPTGAAASTRPWSRVASAGGRHHREDDDDGIRVRARRMPTARSRSTATRGTSSGGRVGPARTPVPVSPRAVPLGGLGSDTGGSVRIPAAVRDLRAQDHVRAGPEVGGRATGVQPRHRRANGVHRTRLRGHPAGDRGCVGRRPDVSRTSGARLRGCTRR